MASKGASSIPPFPSDLELCADISSVLSAQGVFMNMRKYSHAPKIAILK